VLGIISLKSDISLGHVLKYAPSFDSAFASS